jgi:hypothetical protein
MSPHVRDKQRRRVRRRPLIKGRVQTHQARTRQPVTQHRGLRPAKHHLEWLAHSIRAHVLPVFITQGFEVRPPRLNSAGDREAGLMFPAWGRMIRSRESGVDLVEIQFAAHRRPAFRINAGVAPKRGLITPRAHWPAEELAVHWLSEWFESYARPWLRPLVKAVGLEPLGAWFSVWHWPWQSPVRDDYENLALSAARIAPELEAALRGGELGRHVRRVVVPPTASDPPQPRTS